MWLPTLPKLQFTNTTCKKAITDFHLSNEGWWEIFDGLCFAFAASHLVFGHTSIHRVCVGKVVRDSHLVSLIAWGELLSFEGRVEHCRLQILDHLVGSIWVDLLIVIPGREVWVGWWKNTMCRDLCVIILLRFPFLQNCKTNADLVTIITDKLETFKNSLKTTIWT